jgi:hypothetical protein
MLLSRGYITFLFWVGREKFLMISPRSYGFAVTIPGRIDNLG